MRSIWEIQVYSYQDQRCRVETVLDKDFDVSFARLRYSVEHAPEVKSPRDVSGFIYVVRQKKCELVRYALSR